MAVNDAAGALEGEAVDIAVMANDYDFVGFGLVIVAVSQPRYGNVALNGDGTLHYSAPLQHTGVDSFTYTVEDGLGRRSTAAVAVAITWCNETDDAPQVEVINPTQPNTTVFTDSQTIVVVEVPASVITDTTSVTDVVFLSYTQVVTPTEKTADAPSGYQFGNFEFDLTAFVNDVPQHGIEFAQPITLTIQYNPNSMAGLDLSTLELFYWRGSSWSSDGIEIVEHDLKGAKVTIILRHLSEFAFFAVPTLQDTNLWLPLINSHMSQTVYVNSFNSDTMPGWSKQQRTTAPSGEKFLGEFGNQVVTLNLGELPAHKQITISFDLYIIRSWDGNQVEISEEVVAEEANGAVGPDVWRLSADGQQLIVATFSNVLPERQTYPGAYPEGDFAAQSGAMTVNTLGYRYAQRDMDATYRITQSFVHSAGNISFEFAAGGLQILEDESWGIDNVHVMVE